MIIKITQKYLNQIHLIMGGRKAKRNINLGAAQTRWKWLLTLSINTKTREEVIKLSA